MQTITFVLCATLACNALASGQNQAAMANPIRKVVNLLDGMASKVETEGEKEKEIYDKYMCSCKTHKATLKSSIDENSAKVPALASQIAEDSSALAGLKETLATHKNDMATAQSALEAAEGLRKKESDAFTAESTEKNGFIAAISKALPALRQGTAGFLQTDTALATNLRQAAALDTSLTDDDREVVMSLLSVNGEANEYAPAGGESVGILENMLDNYQKDVATLTSTENQAAATYEELLSAKTREVQVHKTAIQKKTERSGELSVAVVEKKSDKKQTESMVAADQAMFDKLNANCAAETPAYEERDKMRSNELAAIAETKKILNDDDALDVFKATLPAGAGALLQMESRSKLQRRLQHARDAAALFKNQPNVRPELRFLELALMGKKVDFTKVTKLIDDMIALLARETKDDDTKKKYCDGGLSDASAKAKVIAKSISEQEANQDDRAETMAAVEEELKSTQGEITALDSLTADATTERKAQNAEFTEFMASNSAAKEILQFASKRLREFYQPLETALLAKQAAVKKQGHVTEDQLISPLDKQSLFKELDYRLPKMAQAASFVSFQVQTQSNKVLGMIKGLVGDVSKEMIVAQKDEEHSQKVYENLMADSSEKRMTYTKALQAKQSAKADHEEAKTLEDSSVADSYKEKTAQAAYTAQLHTDCDWLLLNFDLRKSARADEAENLGKAKAVLHGADFSFVQLHSRSLRGHA